jgi:DNA-directed RNA polymerase subunit RPC12/RpoP
MEEKMKKAECVCAACNAQFDVDDEMLFGEMILCPYCHAEVYVPPTQSETQRVENKSAGTASPWNTERDLMKVLFDLTIKLSQDLESANKKIENLEMKIARFNAID